MEIGMIGLGKMGGNMALRLSRKGIRVVGFDRDPQVVAERARAGAIEATASLDELLSQLDLPRVLWLMLPSGPITEHQIDSLLPRLQPGDVIVDGGNAHYRDSERRGRKLGELGIEFVDAGTSGGIWGLNEGYCMMVGGNPRAITRLTPVLQALAPSPERGWAHVGPSGAGHYVKMIHNGIEYGMMQALAEGMSLLDGKREYALDPAAIAELWREGSVIRSWLLDLTATGLARNPQLEGIAPVVADSGEGRWTVQEAIQQGVATPVLSLALQARFQSQDQHGYGLRLLALMRNAFGGHDLPQQG